MTASKEGLKWVVSTTSRAKQGGQKIQEGKKKVVPTAFLT